MNETEYMLENLEFYFVIKEESLDGLQKFSLSSFARFSNDVQTLCFDTEEDTALYLLDMARNGGQVSSNDLEVAQAILRGDKPMFAYEEKQIDNTILYSLHDHLPSEASKIIAFASRSPRLIARFILKRQHESKRVRITDETRQLIHSIMD